MSYLNLGIVAHVDAGKTSLTERLLHHSGVIDRPGSVDRGDTTTDSLALERERGITIRASVASFPAGDVTVNVLDTPGHPDFIAEVDRSLAVLDGAVLVLSAVEGVQAQTLVLMRALQRLRLPVIVFVNKIDRRGARPDAVADAVARRLSPDVLPVQRVLGAGTPGARAEPLPDDGLRAWLADESRRGTAHPVLFGSAATGVGVPEMVAALGTYLPVVADGGGATALTNEGAYDAHAADAAESCSDAASSVDAAGAPSAVGPGADAPSGVVFAIDREDGRKRAFVRMRSGVLRVRDRVDLRHGKSERITALRVANRGTLEPRSTAEAGQIAVVQGLATARVGDVVGPERPGDERGSQFPPPSYETVVDAAPGERGRLYAALSELAEQDPLIRVRRRDEEITVSLYGEVQREVLAAILQREYRVDARFGTVRTARTERLVGAGHAVEIKKQDGNEFHATIGLRVEPVAPGSGVTFELECERGSMPPAFFDATEDTVRRELARGPLHWPVPDARIVMTHSGYSPRQSHMHQKFNKAMSSTGADFRGLAPRVLAAAIRRAGTVLCEPVHRFVIELPEDTVGPVASLVGRLGGVPFESRAGSGGIVVMRGEMPAAAVAALQRDLPGLTHGEGMCRTEHDRFEPVREAARA
ncbi:TetM/TetW/TetO/TetS family tetracycline resistance ribosomal protection protein [Promicromonospora sukumoe]|uniref:Ribosomal protection tetracycline resistance protein n=1 Tax=Promicromonospora sukumoe TaxID=88382 RepID=A0A7W3PEV4_9MICO|nr:TetM/TetW/TetO/TetS family tetracycline resistance ribosomal protection protein [Promicromonospora sukumoe]MBA8809141.1 ribosomal protection tetracycline resistance protein [Promicromonospora sukumoe]